MHSTRDPLDLLVEASGRLAQGEQTAIEIDAPDGQGARAQPAFLARQAERLGLELLAPAPGGDPAVAARGTLRIGLRRVAAPPRWRIARLDPQRADEARALFERVFGRPMPAELWRWKYGEGRGNAIGAWRDGRLVAHYGGLTRGILMRGRPALASQSCDVMVDASERGTLSRHGPLFLTAATYLEREVGEGARHLVGFGFPNERAWRVAQRLGLYGGPVGRVLSLQWRALARSALSPAELRWLGGGSVLRGLAARVRASTFVARPLDPREPAGGAFADACWRAMAAELGEAIVGVRDARWLAHRYRDHPSMRYEIVGVSGRASRRPVGVLVLRRGAESAELLDVVARPRDVAALVIRARRVVHQWGLASMRAWVSENIAGWFGDDAAISDPGVNVPCCAWTPGPPPEETADRWWLTGGDTDFL